MALADLSDIQRSFIAKYIASPTQTTDSAGSAEWDKLNAALEPLIAAALKANHPEASKIRAAAGMAQEKAGAADFASAVKIGTRLQSLLGSSAGSDAASEIPKNVVAFQKSRVIWVSAKKDMKSGLAALRNAIVSQADGDDDKAEIISAADSLVSQFDAIDTKLEDILDEITNTPEGSQRTALKTQAGKTLEAYQQVLKSPFFASVDSNPFSSVNVTARGQQALAAVGASLR